MFDLDGLDPLLSNVKGKVGTKGEGETEEVGFWFRGSNKSKSPSHSGLEAQNDE